MQRTHHYGLVSNDEGIQLTDKELDTLREASRIAEKARELAREIDSEFEDHWLDLTLAGIEHPIHQDISEGWLPVKTDPIPWL